MGKYLEHRKQINGLRVRIPWAARTSRKTLYEVSGFFWLNLVKMECQTWKVCRSKPLWSFE
jgi:hypothetical protein